MQIDGKDLSEILDRNEMGRGGCHKPGVGGGGCRLGESWCGVQRESRRSARVWLWFLCRTTALSLRTTLLHPYTTTVALTYFTPSVLHPSRESD